MPTDLVRFASLLLTLGGTLAALGAGPEDWPMAGRTSTRNPVVTAGDAPLDWDVQNGKNIRWSAKLGSVTYGTPVVADGHVYVGTNNGAGYLKRYPSTTDLGCLLCFRESDGEFLSQFSAEKLAVGRVHDWPPQGIGCPPLVQGDRLWLISNRWEVVCLDTQGFRDGKNDGEYDEEAINHPTEADVMVITLSRFAITFFISQRGLVLVNCLAIQSQRLRSWRCLKNLPLCALDVWLVHIASDDTDDVDESFYRNAWHRPS